MNLRESWKEVNQQGTLIYYTVTNWMVGPKKKLFDGEIELMPLDVLSEELGIHMVTLCRYVRQEKLKACKIGLSYYVSKDNLKDFTNFKN